MRCFLCIMVVMAIILTGCGKSDTKTDNTPTAAAGGETVTPEPGNTAASGQDNSSDNSGAAGGESTPVADNAGVPDMSAFKTKPSTENYVELALNVYYNDADHSYFSNESGKNSIFVTEAGQYALEFDCANDLSAEAVAAGVEALKNLTAIYIIDMEHIRGEGQSPLTACNIIYDKVIVDGTELTVTMDAPKSALKSNGIFDTNDPVNSWDGSCVAEVEAGEHVANFTTVNAPKKVSVVFTLSDFVWGTDTSASGAGVTEPAGAVIGENGAVFSTMDLTGMDAKTLSYYMGNGINLGNTFEATAGGKYASVTTYECAWGQPITSEAMIQGYKAAGFDTLRIPVSWCNTMDFANGDFEINADYIERVATVVNWALDAEMFVVLNDHWDSGWWAMFGSSNPDTVAKAWQVYEAIWTQVSTYFKDYSDMLIFESANEELGNGLNNNGNWPDSGSLSTDDQYRLTNEINQKFVDIVRSTGGNNDDRFLLIAGYNTDISDTCDNRYKLPADTAKGKLFLSVHYYTPWNYCGAGEGGTWSRWGIKADYETMDKYLGMLKKFDDAGCGIIIGEYGALPVYENGKHETQENTVEFTEYFLDHCDINNWVPLLWDTNSSYNKTTCTFRDEAVAAVFAKRSFEKEYAAGDAYPGTVKAHMETASAEASEMWDGVETYEPGTPVAWIMWNGGAGTYSVGDVFNPADNTAGIKATNAIVEGPGKYSVSLDFAGGNNGLTFAALAIADAELLYPGCHILIDSIKIDGKEIELIATPYTSSDDGKCTRVNLVNEWVKTPPADARILKGSPSTASAVIIDKTQLVGIKNITIDFTLAVIR
ncbi:MAG: glycoside hydrolase family 5 protein [Lachnospiraceae bacterium]|nr:glycoside hydrolase family 5 protein [Lachnospiraceae bacterium]